MKVFFFLVAFASLFQNNDSSCFDSTNEDNYKKLEDMMVSNEEIIKLLQDTFYPTNLHSKKIINVTYEVFYTEVEAVHFTSSKICFFWLSSPVHLMINKDMLEGLSLLTFIPEYSNLIIPLNISELCQHDFEDVLRELSSIENLKNNDSSIQDLCNGNYSLLEILNNFTTNVSPTFVSSTSTMKGICALPVSFKKEVHYGFVG